MRQFLFGAVCGGALSAVICFGVIDRPGNPASQASPMTSPTANIDLPAPTPTPQISDRTMQAPVPSSPVKAITITTAQVPRPPSELPAVVAPIVNRQTSPVDLSAEHSKMLAPDNQDNRRLTPAELHAQFASEPKDQDWALQMERALSEFISSKNPEGEFEILAVDCRATLCEIRAFGNLANSMQRWNEFGSEMGKQPWWRNFSGNSTSASGQNGRTAIVTILQRTKR